MPLAGRDVKAIVILRRTEDISIHAPLAGRDAIPSRLTAVTSAISIHAPLAGRDDNKTMLRERLGISIHAPLAGRDREWANRCMLELISIHAPLAGRDPLPPIALSTGFISIHAPLAGRDIRGIRHISTILYFNPRAPCGARPITGRSNALDVLFQSTRPLRGATFSVRPVWIADHDFNPRAPCGARLCGILACYCKWMISIHAPLAGRDNVDLLGLRSSTAFQSTRPLRGATLSDGEL